MTIFHGGHEDTSAALLGRALTAQSVDLSVLVHLKHLQNA
jgi:hypothetical protein